MALILWWNNFQFLSAIELFEVLYLFKNICHTINCAAIRNHFLTFLSKMHTTAPKYRIFPVPCGQLLFVFVITKNTVTFNSQNDRRASIYYWYSMGTIGSSDALSAVRYLYALSTVGFLWALIIPCLNAVCFTFYTSSKTTVYVH